mmetsp:Transcript_15111/g.22266  ORF Transcript_15111/g.22266 Transcript_15111/m.22266 type:complete len:163 (+) Transcript_15111:126-614(+)
MMSKILLDFIREVYKIVDSIEVDPNIIYFYQVGIGIGFVIVTTLVFFPGEPLGIDYGSRREEAAKNKKVAHDKEEPRTEIIELLKPNSLSKESTRRQEQQLVNADDANLFYRSLNTLVYMVGFALLLYFVNRDYKAHLSIWFASYFPNEARTLGLFVPADHK